MEKREQLNLLDEIGGPQGIADSSLPGLLFAVLFSIGQDIVLASGAALLLGTVLALWRLRQGEGLRFVLVGLLGIALAAFIATRTGSAENFFLPGIILNGGWALLYLFSILVRWPLIGVILEIGTGRGTAWREDPDKIKLYSRASYPWVGLFLLRFTVQMFFYLSGSVVLLGVIKTAMGFPLFILLLWITWVILRRGGMDLSEWSWKKN